MRRSASAALAATAAIGLPVTSAVGAAQAAAPAKAKPKKAVPTRVYTGPSVDMRWGPVQVQLVVKGTRILDVKASYPTERPKSQFINDQAVPLLRSQVLKQQGIKNVYAISGATMTSEAYGQSLQAALGQAHLL